MEHQTSAFSRFYYTHTKYGYSGHSVLPTTSIQRTMDSIQFCEHHVSPQCYIDDEVVGTILMFDVDNEDDVTESLKVTRVIERKLDMNNIDYDTYFSGRKGFHIVTKCMIYGEDSHLVCQAIQKRFFNFDHVDSQIYRNRGTIRAIGSIHLKTGLFKTKINTSWSMARIKAESSTFRRVIADFNWNRTSASVFTNKIFIPPRKELSSDIEYEYTASPCVNKMIADKNPPRELWHKIIYTLAKHCLGSGMTVESAISLFDNGFFGSTTASGYNRSSYIKVVRSVYRAGVSQLGCKTGLSSDAMKHYCSGLCIFNPDSDFSKINM